MGPKAGAAYGPSHQPIDKVISIDQSPLAARARIPTYWGLDLVRKVFANTKDARQFGFKGRFSFNRPGGCECQGRPGGWACRTCSFPARSAANASINRLFPLAKAFSPMSPMPVEKATASSKFPDIHRVLTAWATLTRLLIAGLTTLSGGERRHQAGGLALPTGPTLYLDSPPPACNLDDAFLLGVPADGRSGQHGIAIEHHLDVLKCLGWLLDLGPDGGSAGGFSCSRYAEAVAPSAAMKREIFGDAWCPPLIRLLDIGTIRKRGKMVHHRRHARN